VVDAPRPAALEHIAGGLDAELAFEAIEVVVDLVRPRSVEDVRNDGVPVGCDALDVLGDVGVSQRHPRGSTTTPTRALPPAVPDIWSQGNESACHGAGSPRMARRTQDSVANTRWRSVSMNDHSPLTLSCSSAGATRRARATVSAQSDSMTSHASRKPAASV